MTYELSPNFTFSWQAEQRIRSRNRIWIVSDIHQHSASFYPWSHLQRWFRVGAVDLASGCIGYFRFGVDDARAMLKAGLPQPPWEQPLPYGISIIRASHDGEAKGRYFVEVTQEHLDPQLLAMGPDVRKKFARAGHKPNASPGMWQELLDRVQLEKEIETTALSMFGEFSAGDVKKALGKDVNVTPVLQRLVRQNRLAQFGKKRGTRYQLAPPDIPTRADWTE